MHVGAIGTMVNGDSEKITSDFQCFVCGAIFSTDQDKRQHLEKELHGQAHDGSMKDDAKVVQEQTELSEGHRQKYESTA